MNGAQFTVDGEQWQDTVVFRENRVSHHTLWFHCRQTHTLCLFLQAWFRKKIAEFITTLHHNLPSVADEVIIILNNNNILWRHFLNVDSFKTHSGDRKRMTTVEALNLLMTHCIYFKRFILSSVCCWFCYIARTNNTPKCSFWPWRKNPVLGCSKFVFPFFPDMRQITDGRQKQTILSLQINSFFFFFVFLLQICYKAL